MLYLRNGRADWHRTKGMWVDRMLDSHCDLNFDLTHDLHLGSSRSVFTLLNYRRPIQTCLVTCNGGSHNHISHHITSHHITCHITSSHHHITSHHQIITYHITQSTNTGKSIRFVNRNLIANQPINQYQKFELLISVIHFWYSNMGKSIALPISEVEFPILMNYVKNIWIFSDIGKSLPKASFVFQILSLLASVCPCVCWCIDPNRRESFQFFNWFPFLPRSP